MSITKQKRCFCASRHFFSGTLSVTFYLKPLKQAILSTPLSGAAQRSFTLGRQKNNWLVRRRWYRSMGQIFVWSADSARAHVVPVLHQKPQTSTNVHKNQNPHFQRVLLMAKLLLNYPFWAPELQALLLRGKRLFYFFVPADSRQFVRRLVADLWRFGGLGIMVVSAGAVGPAGDARDEF